MPDRLTSHHHRGEPVSDDHSPLALGPLFVAVATKLFARTGEWPRWFVCVVGDRVPGQYVDLALYHRPQLERDMGCTLPLTAPPPAHGSESLMTQVGIPGVGGRAATGARPRRSA